MSANLKANDSLSVGDSFLVENSCQSLNRVVLKQMGDGSMKSGAPKMNIGLVDVRDVAEPHFAAGFTPAAQGRYITSGHETNFYEMAMLLQPRFGKDFPLPKKSIPKWLLMIVGPKVNKLFSRKFIKRNIDAGFRADLLVTCCWLGSVIREP